MKKINMEIKRAKAIKKVARNIYKGRGPVFRVKT
jgi:hypothetical protein